MLHQTQRVVSNDVFGRLLGKVCEDRHQYTEDSSACALSDEIDVFAATIPAMPKTDQSELTRIQTQMFDDPKLVVVRTDPHNKARDESYNLVITELRAMEPKYVEGSRLLGEANFDLASMMRQMPSRVKNLVVSREQNDRAEVEYYHKLIANDAKKVVEKYSRTRNLLAEVATPTQVRQRSRHVIKEPNHTHQWQKGEETATSGCHLDTATNKSLDECKSMCWDHPSEMCASITSYPTDGHCTLHCALGTSQKSCTWMRWRWSEIVCHTFSLSKPKNQVNDLNLMRALDDTANQEEKDRWAPLYSATTKLKIRLQQIKNSVLLLDHVLDKFKHSFDAVDDDAGTQSWLIFKRRMSEVEHKFREIAKAMESVYTGGSM